MFFFCRTAGNTFDVWLLGLVSTESVEEEREGERKTERQRKRKSERQREEPSGSEEKVENICIKKSDYYHCCLKEMCASELTMKEGAILTGYFSSVHNK